MSNRDWDNDFYHDSPDSGYRYSGGYSSPVPSSGEDARRQFEQLKSDNLRSLQNVSLETDERGQATFLGMPVSKEMKPVVEMALDSVKPFIIDQSDKVSKGASALAKKIGFAKSHATVGLVAENVFRWGIVGTKQIFDTIKASNKYAHERKELFTTLSPVMQATGANLHNNEVIRVAYEELHQNWMTDMKKMAADLPSLIPTAVFAWEDQVASAKKRAAKQVVSAVNGSSAEDIAMAHAKQVTEQIERSQATEKAITSARDKVAEQYKGDPAVLSQQLDNFDTYTARAIRDAEAKKWHDTHNGHEHHDAAEKPKNTDRWLMGIIPITALVSQTLKSNIQEQADARRKRVKAWKMIEHLKAELESHCGDKRGRGNEYDDCDRSFTSKSPEEIYISGKGNRDGDSLNLKEYIIEVFQQHERDREPGRNFYDKETGKAIDPLRGVMLTNLMPAVEIIAEHIADGTLSGDALYKLVGENKVIKHSPSGARVFVKEDELRKVIDQELAPVLGTREVVKLEEFMAKFADPALIQDTLKNNLESMHGMEKSLFASLFPDDILAQAGMKKKEIFEARRQAHQYAQDFVSATVMHLSKKSGEELKQLGVTEQEADAIHSLAQKVEEGDVRAIKLAVDGRDKEVVDAVRTAGLLEQVQGGADGGRFWTDRVKEMGAVRETIKKNSEKHRSEDSFKGDSAERDDRWGKSSSSRRYRKDFGHDEGRDTGGGYNDWDNKPSGFSDRFEPVRQGYSARERLAHSRDASREDVSDLRM